MDRELGNSGFEILILFLSFDQLLLKLGDLLFRIGKFLRIFWLILTKFPHTFFRTRKFLFQIAAFGQERLHALFRFLHSFQLVPRLIPFLGKSGDLLVRLCEFRVGFVLLLFRRQPRLVSGSDRVFQAGDFCT